MTEIRRDRRGKGYRIARVVFAGRQGEQRQEGKGREQTRGNKMTEKATVSA